MNRHVIYLLLVASLVVFTGIALQPTQQAGSATEQVEAAWAQALESERYEYSSRIVQTTYPAPSVINAGRAPREDVLGMAGTIMPGSRQMELSLWPDGSFAPARQVEMRVDGERAFMRASGGEWEEIDNVSESAAPGGDPFSFLAGMENVRFAETETRTVGTLTFAFDRYEFELNGAAYGRHLNDVLEQMLRERGELPAGLSLDAAHLYRQLEGTGELWLDEHGLPTRLQMNLQFPPEENGELVHAVITSDFSDYQFANPIPAFSTNPLQWVQAQAALLAQPENVARMTLWTAVFFLASLTVWLTLRYWESEELYAFVASLMIGGLVVVPLLHGQQMHDFYEGQQVQVTEQETRQAEAEAQIEANELLRNRWDPHQNPLSDELSSTDVEAEVRQLAVKNGRVFRAAADVVSQTTDTDGDGLSDEDEDDNYTCAYAGATYCTDVSDPTDSDGDGLTDGAEVNELDTIPTEEDSDGDSISDALEVEGFLYNGTMWYLDPLNTDSNNDGLLDGIECEAFSSLSENFDASGTCADTDSDGTPDIFDADNDGDGVDDDVDLSPQISSDVYNDGSPFSLTIDNLETDKPVFVDLQFRPTEEEHLTFYSRLLDWPGGDYEGQIQRVMTTTFATTDNPDIALSSSNADYGDIQLVPMLEVYMPYSDSHYANLPVNATYSSQDRTIGVAVEDWIDDTELEPYGITVRDVDETSGDLVAYLPVSIVTDEDASGLEAFTTRMVYYPEQGSSGVVDWGSAHEMRLIWAVQVITDSCIDESEDVETCDREDSLSIVQIYDEEWLVTGLSVSEEHGLDVALVYEDPSADTDLQIDDQLWLASWNLSNTFLRGRDCDSWDGTNCSGDGTRDVRIDNLASSISGWITGDNILQVETFSYLHQGYLAQTMMTETISILDNHFTPYADETDPTLMIVQEQNYRSLNVEEVTDSLDGSLTLDFDPDDVKLTTLANLNWTPYDYVDGAWTTADVEDYLASLEGWLSNNSSFLADVTGDEEEEEGKLIWAQVYYTTLYNGYSGIAYIEGETIWVAATGTLDEGDFELMTAGSSNAEAMVEMAEQYETTLTDIINSVKKSYKTLGKWGKFYQAFNASSFGLTEGRLLLKVQQTSMYAVKVTAALVAVGAILIVAGLLSGDSTLTAVGTYIVLAGSAIIIAARTAMIVSQMVSVFKSTTGVLKTVSALTKVSKTARSLAKVSNGLAALAIWGLFAYQVTALDLNGNGVSAALAYALAATVALLILIAIEFIPIVGPLIVALLSLIDLILFLFGEKGITDLFTEWLADLLYRANEVIENLDDADRIEYEIQTLSLVDEDSGFIEQNGIDIALVVTNTIRYSNDFSDSDARRSTFRYFASTNDDDMHNGLSDNDMKDEWVSLDGNYLQITETVALEDAIALSSVGTGINRDLDGLFYLTEAYVAPYEGCWLPDSIFATTGVSCDWYKTKGSNPMNLGESLIFDVLPNSISEFVTLEWDGFGEVRFPDQQDFDGDGLLSVEDGGTDPDDTKFDTDGDELSDAYEITYGYDPSQEDSDGDGLTDKEELQYGTDIDNADSDGDTLSDYIEAKVGWLVPYEDASGNTAVTRVWSDPFSTDADGDSLSDLQEFIFGFNPWVSTDPSLIENIVEFDNLTVEEEGTPIWLLKGEEAAGVTVFADSSGEGNHAICDDGSSSCPAAGINGKYGGAIQFDGSNDYLEIDNVIDPGATDFTAALWFYVDAFDTGTYQRIIAQESSMTWLGLTSSGYYYTFMDQYLASGIADLNAEQWYHGAVTYDGTTLTLYLDGVALSSAEVNIASSSSPLRVGVDDNSQNFYFNGLMDEMVIIDEALDTDGIGDLMNGRYNLNDLYVRPGSELTYNATITNTSATNSASAIMVAESSVIDPAIGQPIIALSLDGDDTRIIFDNEVGSDTVYCYDNGTCPTIGASGAKSYAVTFDGVDDRIVAPAIQRPAATEHLLAFWINVDTLPTSGEVAYILDTESEEEGALDIYLTDSGQIAVDIEGAEAVATSNFTFSAASGWQHVLINFSNGSSVEYRNNYGGGDPYRFSLTTRPDLIIGPGYFGSNVANDQPFNGSLDDLVFYNDSFSDSTSASYGYHELIYNGTYHVGTADSNVSDHYPSYLLRFNEVESEPDPDEYLSIPNGSGGTVNCDSASTCPTMLVDGYSGYGASFDGVDDYIPINSSNEDDFEGTFYIKLDARPTEKAYIFDWEESTNIDNSDAPVLWTVLYIDSAGRIVTELYESDNDIMFDSVSTSSVIFDDSQLGVWTKIYVYYEQKSDNVEFTLQVDDAVIDGLTEHSLDHDDESADGYEYEVHYGGGHIGSAVDGSYPIDGTIDEMTIKYGSNLGTAYTFSFEYEDEFEPLDINFVNDVTEAVVAHCDTAFYCPEGATGVYGDALAFDGEYEFITMTQSIDTGTTDFTIATWFKADDLDSYQRLLHQQGDSSSGIGRVWFGLDGSQLYTFLGGGYLSANSTLQADTWYHAAVTYDGTTLSLYLDGVLMNSSTVTVEESDGEVIIGRQKDAEQYYFDGLMDEIQIWPVHMEADGIAFIMNNPVPAIEVPLTAVSADIPTLTTETLSNTAIVSSITTAATHQIDIEAEVALNTQTAISIPVIDDNSADLEIYLPFEDVPGSTVFENLADDTVEATCSGDHCPTAGVRGIIGRSAYFDGVDDYLDIANSGLDAVSVWVKATRGTIIDLGATDDREGFELDVDRFRVVTENNNNHNFQDIELDIPENVWTHIVGVMDDDNEIAYAYVNGQLVGSTSLNGDSNGFSTSEPTVGSNRDGSDFLLGQIDDLRVYNNPISADNVLALYEESAPRFRFEFDEESDATSFIDITANQYVGVPSSSIPCTTLTLESQLPFSIDDGVEQIKFAIDGEEIISHAVSDLTLREQHPIDVSTYFCEEVTITVSMVDSGDTTTALGSTTIQATSAGSNSFNQYSGGTIIYGYYDVDDEISYQSDPIFGTDGQIGNTALFDGAGYIDVVDDSIPLNLNDEDFTLMAWIKTDASVSSGILVKTDDDSSWESGEKAFYIDDSGYPSFVGYGNSYITGNTAVNDDIWHHVVVVWDYDGSGTSGTGTMFVDGVDVTSTDSYTANNDDNAGNTIKIGGTNYGETDAIFEGQLDELAAYQRALSESEIYSIYLRELRWYRDHGRSLVIVDDDVPTIDLLSDYEFRAKEYIQLAVSVEDDTSGIAYVEFGLWAPGDSDYTWQAATPCNDSTVVWCPSFIPTSSETHLLQFRAIDGVGNETISEAYTIIVDDTSPETVSSYSDTPIVPAETAAYQWQVDLNGTISDDLSGVYTETVTVDLVDSRGQILGEPSQIASVDGSNWSLVYEVNRFRPVGTYDVQVTAEDNVGNRSSTIVGSVTMDVRPTTLQSQSWLLDSTVISQTAVISGVVSDQPDWGGTAIYHFEEPTGATTFYDYSGQENHAACTVCPVLEDSGSPFGQSLAFDGTDSYLTVPITTINPLEDEFSIALWFNINDNDINRTLVTQTDGSGNGHRFLFVQASGLLASFLGGSVTRGETTVSLSEWHHAAMTYDGSTLNLYLDGKLEASALVTAESADGELLVGIGKDLVGQFFNGSIDELSIYESILSPEEIFALAQSDVSGVDEVEYAVELIDFDTISTTTTLDENAQSWQTAVLDQSGEAASTWSFDVPVVTEGIYQIHARSSDGDDNQETAVTVWDGLIDTVSPVITATGQQVLNGASTETEYTFTFTDFILDEEALTQPCAEGDLVSLDYDDDSLPYDGLPYEISATCRVSGHEASRDIIACDAVGHCTTETVIPSGVEATTSLTVSTTLQGRTDYSALQTITFYQGDPLSATSSYTATTSALGTVTLGGLTAGTYSVTVKADGYLAVLGSVALVDGETATLDLGMLLAGDASGDNVVNIADLSILAGAYNSSSGDGSYVETADFNGDGIININDLSLLSTNYNEVGAAP